MIICWRYSKICMKQKLFIHWLISMSLSNPELDFFWIRFRSYDEFLSSRWDISITGNTHCDNLLISINARSIDDMYIKYDFYHHCENFRFSIDDMIMILIESYHEFQIQNLKIWSLIIIWNSSSRNDCIDIYFHWIIFEIVVIKIRFFFLTITYVRIWNMIFVCVHKNRCFLRHPRFSREKKNRMSSKSNEMFTRLSKKMNWGSLIWKYFRHLNIKWSCKTFSKVSTNPKYVKIDALKKSFFHPQIR